MTVAPVDRDEAPLALSHALGAGPDSESGAISRPRIDACDLCPTSATSAFSGDPSARATSTASVQVDRPSRLPDQLRKTTRRTRGPMWASRCCVPEQAPQQALEQAPQQAPEPGPALEDTAATRSVPVALGARRGHP